MAAIEPIGIEVFPPEVKESPNPFIGIMGGDDLYDFIVDACQRLSPRRINFEKFSLDHCFPEKKAVETTNPTSNPNGLFKKNWFFKHQHLIPSVLIPVFDCGSTVCSGDVWNSQESIILESLNTIRNNLGSRAINIQVLIWWNISSRDDPQIDENINNLKSKVERGFGKISFLIRQDLQYDSQNLTKFVNIILESSKSYYTDISKTIKKKFKKYPKAQSQYAWIHARCNTKIAYYYQLRGQNNKTEKYYKAAYTALEGTLEDGRINLTEKKSLAELINFKLCLLSLAVREFEKSKQQYDRHISIFRNNQGERDKLFLHWKWMSNQHAIFADLLIQTGNRDKSFRDPGVYFHNSAICAIERRKCAQQFNLYRASQTSPSPIPQGYYIASSDYLGGLPNLIPNEEFAPVSPIIQRNADRLVFYEEKMVDHCYLVVAILQKVLEHSYGGCSKRIQAKIESMMAAEYYESHDYEQAKFYYDGLVELYRDEQWFSPLSSILDHLQHCAYQLNKLEVFWNDEWKNRLRDYVEYALQLMSPSIEFDFQRKAHIQKTMVQILSSRDRTASFDSVEAEIQSTSFDLELSQDLLLCTPRFSLSLVSPGQKFWVCLEVISSFPYPIQFCAVAVKFTDPEYDFVLHDSDDPLSRKAVSSDSNQHLQVHSTTQLPDDEAEFKSISANLVFLPNKIRRLWVARIAGNAVGKDLSVSKLCFLLNFSQNNVDIDQNAENAIFSTGTTLMLKIHHTSLSSEFQQRKLYRSTSISESNIPDSFLQVDTLNNRISIVQPKPVLDLSLFHDAPGLVGEQFLVAVEVSVISRTDQINFFLSTADEKLSMIWLDENDQHDSVREYGIVLSGNELTMSRPPSQGKFCLFFAVTSNKSTHSTDIVVNATCFNERRVLLKAIAQDKIAFVPPWSLQYQALKSAPSIKNSSDSVKNTGNEPFFLSLALSSGSEHVLHLDYCHYCLPQRGCVGYNTHSFDMRDIVVYPGDTLSTVYPLTPTGEFEEQNVGSLQIVWKRQSFGVQSPHIKWPQKELQLITSLVPLFSLPVEYKRIRVLTEIPPTAVVGHPFGLRMRIDNNTDVFQDLSVSVSDSPLHGSSVSSVIFAGSKNRSLTVAPQSHLDISYSFIATKLGFVHLPSITLHSKRLETDIWTSGRSLHLFVHAFKSIEENNVQHSTNMWV